MPSRPASCSALALAALALALFGVSAARAQPYQNPNLPPSPYALPVPQYHEGADDDDDDDFDAPPPGEWRHWGDDKSQGELFKQFFAPDGVAGGGGYVPDPARARFCRQHPDACD